MVYNSGPILTMPNCKNEVVHNDKKALIVFELKFFTRMSSILFSYFD